MSKLLIVSICVTVLLSVAAGTPQPCTNIDAASASATCGTLGTICLNGLVNPNPLNGAPNNIFTVKDNANPTPFTYYFSATGLPSTFTTPVAPNTCANVLSNPSTTYVSLQAQSQCYGAGALNAENQSWTYDPAPSGSTNPQIVVKYTGGQGNKPGTLLRETQVTINCNPSATQDTFQWGSSFPSGVLTVYAFTITSKAACGKQVCAGAPGAPGSSSGAPVGWILVGLFLGGIFLYVAIGVAIAHRGHPELSFSEKLPHREFWSEVPTHIKNGFAFSKNKITGGKGGGGTYTAM